MRSCLALLLVMVLTACARERLYLVGVQADASHALMAEMLAETLRRTGRRTVEVPCDDLRHCAQLLRAGEVDLLPAYSGDVIALGSGQTAGNLRLPGGVYRAFAALDVMLGPDLGFEAPFRVVMRRDRAREAGVETIGDLARLQGGVKFAVPEDYATRPGDGLYALSRQYGFNLARGEPLVVENDADRVAQLLQDEVDAAVLRDFGYDLAEFGVAALKDSLGFFPRYHATVLLGPSAAEAERDLRRSMAPLTGRVKQSDMRELVHDVVVQGWTPAHAARRFLVDKGIAEALGPGIARPPIVLAVDPRDDLGAQREVAARVVSRAFPERPVEFLGVFDPLGALAAGRAEIALVDTEDFFRFGRGRPFAERETRGEAAAVIGERRLYLLRSAGADGADPLAGKIAVQPYGSTGARVAAAILSGLDREAAAHHPLAKLLELLETGEIDATLVLASPRPDRIIEALRGRRVRLESLAPHVSKVPLFLADTRIPAGTLPGQEEPVDTFSMQLLLAGAAPRSDYALRSGGPASAILTAGQPLSEAEAEALVRASPTRERPASILPSIWTRAPARAQAEQEVIVNAFDTALNIAVFVFVAWVALLLVRGNAVRLSEPPER